MIRYHAFVDPSGGSVDSAALAIAHAEKNTNRIVLDGTWERVAPHSPASVVEEFASILKQYHCTKVVGDRYGGEFPRELFRKQGITYELSEKTRSELYLEFLVLLNSNRIVLPLYDRLLRQLRGLLRRVGPSGRESVDHGVGAHDDLANAAAGACCLAATVPARKFFQPTVITCRVGRTDFSPSSESGNLDDPYYDSGHDAWHKV